MVLPLWFKIQILMTKLNRNPDFNDKAQQKQSVPIPPKFESRSGDTTLYDKVCQ
jgi:hypothetical protein